MRKQLTVTPYNQLGLEEVCDCILVLYSRLLYNVNEQKHLQMDCVFKWIIFFIKNCCYNIIAIVLGFWMFANGRLFRFGVQHGYYCRWHHPKKRAVQNYVFICFLKYFNYVVIALCYFNAKALINTQTVPKEHSQYIISNDFDTGKSKFFMLPMCVYPQSIFMCKKSFTMYFINQIK